MRQGEFCAAAVIVAAGSGERLGADQPKALVDLVGTPLIVRAVRGIADSGAVRTVVIAAPAGHLAEFRKLVAGPENADSDAELTSLPASSFPELDISVIPGGKTRQESVAAALAELPPEVTHVLVHDAARCLTPPSVINSVITALQSGAEAVIPALEVVDTIKTVAVNPTNPTNPTNPDDDGAAPLARVTGTLDRAALRAVQTPQGFELQTLLTAHRDQPAHGAGASDDAGMVEALGREVLVVPGAEEALKITKPADLQRAANFLPAQLPRTGIAIDVHPVNTASDAPLCVAGLKWADKPRLAGHSDGDVVAHAVCDSVLSAAGLGDLGAHFGTADPEYAGASGERFLQETARILHDAGYRIGNVAVQLVGPFPRLGTRRKEAEQILSTALGAPVSLSATTTDGLGFTGRGDGLAAIATALVQQVE